AWGKSRPGAPRAPTVSPSTTSCCASPRSWATRRTTPAGICTDCDAPTADRDRRGGGARGIGLSGGGVRYARLAQAAKPARRGTPHCARPRAAARFAAAPGPRARDRPGRAGARGARAVRDDPEGRAVVSVGAESRRGKRGLGTDSAVSVALPLSHQDGQADRFEHLAAVPTSPHSRAVHPVRKTQRERSLRRAVGHARLAPRSEEHTSELQSRGHLVCRLLLEKKNQA